jgi:hypothetical protein
MVRETDCFGRRNGEWKLIYQRASVPSGGDWEGKIATVPVTHRLKTEEEPTQGYVSASRAGKAKYLVAAVRANGVLSDKEVSCRMFSYSRTVSVDI